MMPCTTDGCPGSGAQFKTGLPFRPSIEVVPCDVCGTWIVVDARAKAEDE
jgi:hypothetical protein